MSVLKKHKRLNYGLRKYFTEKYCNLTLSKRKKVALVQSHLIVYGGGGDRNFVKGIARNICRHWNYPKAKVKIGDTHYLVQFRMKTTYIPMVTAESIQSNRHVGKIFMRIEEKTTAGISLMDGINSNTGFFLKSNIGYKGASTEAHEYGHAIGLWPGPDGHPEDLDQRGKGRPGIMYPRGTWVDARYQWDPSVPAGEKGGTVMPDTRRVRKLDIYMLKLDQLNYKKGKAILGGLTNKWHDSDVFINWNG